MTLTPGHALRMGTEILSLAGTRRTLTGVDAINARNLLAKHVRQAVRALDCEALKTLRRVLKHSGLIVLGVELRAGRLPAIGRRCERCRQRLVFDVRCNCEEVSR